MNGNIPDKIRLLHILERIEAIERVLEGFTFDRFFEDEVVQAAVVRWLEVIGEAARYVSDETKNKYKEIEWKKMIGMRNVMIHRYFDIDYLAIWKAVNSLNDLKAQIAAIKLDLNDNF